MIQVIECQIDDMTGEAMGYLMDLLTEDKRVLDAYYTSIHMKKNRPGILLTVLTTASQASAVADLILRESTSFGVRMYPVEREILRRRFEQLDSPYGRCQVKLGFLGDDLIKVVPEYEDVKALAKKFHLAFTPLYQELAVLASEKIGHKEPLNE